MHSIFLYIETEYMECMFRKMGRRNEDREQIDGK